MSAVSKPESSAQQEAEERFLSPQELSERYDVPLQSIYKWRVNKTGPRGFAVGRLVRYRLSDCIAWEQSQMALEDASNPVPLPDHNPKPGVEFSSDKDPQQSIEILLARLVESNMNVAYEQRTANLIAAWGTEALLNGTQLAEQQLTIRTRLGITEKEY